MTDREYLRRLERELTDKGKLVEAGWVSLRIAAIDPTAGKVQLEEMRMAFFAGAQHLLASILDILEDDAEPTENDLRRLDLINNELKAFIDDFGRKYGIRPHDQ